MFAVIEKFFLDKYLQMNETRTISLLMLMAFKIVNAAISDRNVSCKTFKTIKVMLIKMKK